MSNVQNFLVITQNEPHGRFQFGEIFIQWFRLLKEIGCYSREKNQGLDNSFEVHFCNLVQGTMCGHFPFYIPLESGADIPCSVFMHLSTCEEENWNCHKEEFSLTVMNDDVGVAEVILKNFAELLNNPAHHYFIGSCKEDLQKLKLGANA